jgi:hypothetical protein
LLAGQLTIFDVLDEPGDEPLRRLGDGPELGKILLQPLILKGWQLERVRRFAGEPGWLFILSNGVFEVRREGETLADVAVEMFKEAAPLASAATISTA